MSDPVSNSADLKFITEKSKGLACKKEILLPSAYRVLFSLIAKKHNIDIGAEAFYSKEDINDEVYKQILSVDRNTDRAIKAIKEKDELELEKVLEDTRRLKLEIESLKRIAYEDGLTKALNRKWFEDNYLYADAETLRKEGVIVLIDLNDFKQINDTLGHAAGDKVLIYLASAFKKFDSHVVRYGGDEFMLIFENNTPAEVKDIVNVMREIHLKKKYRISNQDVRIHFGYGISEFKDGDSFEEVINNADRLLYEDKQKVKDRVA
jgi:diguanylate cyclase (GGDEF)-like protein